MENTGNTHSILATAATCLRGLNFMMPLQLCVVGSSFAMKRFGYGEEAVSIFVAFCSNAMEILCLYATLSTLAIVTILKALTPQLFIQISSGISMVSVCFTIAINMLLLRTYALDGDVDNITRYYWLLLLANFADGIDVTCVSTIAADNMSPFDLGFALTGLAITWFHWLATRVINAVGVDLDYWLIVSQLLFMVVLSTIAAMLWIVFMIQEKIMAPDASSGNEGGAQCSNSALGFAIGFGRSLPMILASAVSVSSMWAAYPLIAPFELVKFQYHYPIQIVCLVADALSGILVWLMDEYGNCVRHDWYAGKNAWWHMLWLLFIPYLGIAAWFLRCMHYPKSVLAQAVLGRPFVVGPLTVLYYFLGRFLFGFSLVPISINAMGHGEVISPMNIGITIMTTNIQKYMSEAYVQQFKLAKEGIKAGKVWPTDGMSKNDAVRYWIRIAARVGYVNFKEMASADVKQRLGSVTRHIVSYRRISSVV